MNETVSLANDGPVATDPVLAQGEAKADVQAAFAAALIARKETFLARFPRKLKLAVTVLLVCFLGWVLWPQTSTDTLPASQPSTEAVDSPSGVGNPASVKEDTKPVAQFAIPVEPVQLKTDGEKQAAAMNDGTVGSPILLEPAPDLSLVEETQMGVLP
ncbi:MAG: hypothetical protein PHD48_03875, partial [Alphaproteobacteria bacterium]|nr:hypothetical protein [Alphaproteobacteria bacterium]